MADRFHLVGLCLFPIKGCLFRACCNKGVGHHRLCFGRECKAGREVGKVYGWGEEKGRLSGKLGVEAVGMGSWRQTNYKKGILCGWSGSFSDFPWLVLSGKWE